MSGDQDNFEEIDADMYLFINEVCLLKTRSRRLTDKMAPMLGALLIFRVFYMGVALATTLDEFDISNQEFPAFKARKGRSIAFSFLQNLLTETRCTRSIRLGRD